MGKFKKLEKYSSWRKIAMGIWNGPGDPTIYGFEEFRMDDILEFFDEIQAATTTTIKPMHAAVHACAQTMTENPDLNVAIINGRCMKRPSVDIFCQVAVPGKTASEGDLSGVKLRNVDGMDIVEIARALRGRARKVRAGTDEEIERQKSTIDRIPRLLMRNAMRAMEFLTWNVPVDLKKAGLPDDPFGSAMVSSLATYGMQNGFAPLIPSSRTPILLVPGAIYDAVMPHNGEPKVCKAMQLTLTCDHRAFDGLQLSYLSNIVQATYNDFQSVFPTADALAKHHPDGEEAGDRKSVV